MLSVKNFHRIFSRNYVGYSFRHLQRLLIVIFLVILTLSLIISYHARSSSASLSSSLPPSSSTRIMYVVRTSSKFHRTRLIHSLDTWIPLVKQHVYFVTDTIIPNVRRENMILTKQSCPNDTHQVKDLCCKTAHDFLLYHRHENNYDWFCHLDDDQYVHTKNLEKYLSTLDTNQDYYIGRNSWLRPVGRKKKPFWFGTLGAGVCLSKSLLNRLKPYTSNVTQFMNGCIREHYPDDIYIGFLVSEHCNQTLTKQHRFHSHLERDLYNDSRIFSQTYSKQITFGFRLRDGYPRFLPNFFKSKNDTFRMRTLHCLLYPHLDVCQFKLHQFLFNFTEQSK